MYSAYNSPKEPTIEALKLQVLNYYAPEVTERALGCYDLPSCPDLDAWKSVFGELFHVFMGLELIMLGRIISDGQVRAPSRALVKHLAANGVDVCDIWRYKIDYRLSFIDESVAPMWYGVSHAMDKPFWK